MHTNRLKLKAKTKMKRKSRPVLGGTRKIQFVVFSPSNGVRYAVQIILSVLLAAVIVPQGRQSRSLRVFFGRRNTKDSTVTYIILTELPGKHMVEKSNKGK